MRFILNFKFTGLAASILAFVAYIFTVSPTIYGGDSGDLISAAAVLGVPHPPGYPLWTMLAFLFGKLPLAISYAAKINLMSAFFQSATVFLVYLIIYRLTKDILISFVSSLVLAFSYTFWFYALFAEVFSLTNFLAALFVLILLIWQEKRRYFWFVSFVFGLGVFHQYTFVLLLPAAVVFIVLTVGKNALKKKNLWPSLLFFLLGALPYVYVPFAVSFHPPVNWNNVDNVTGILQLMTRAGYGTFQAINFSPPDIFGRIIHFLIYLRFLGIDFGIFGIAITMFGAVGFFWKRKNIFFLTTLGFLFTGPFFFGYINFPLVSSFELGVLERFLLLSYIFFAIVFGFGLFLLKKILARLVNIKFFSISFLIFPSFLFFTNFHKVDLSQNFWGKTLAEDILLTPEPNSILIIAEDTAIFNTSYLHLVENVRPDLAVLTGGLLFSDWYYNQLLARYPHLKYPKGEGEERIKAFLAENVNTLPVYVFDAEASLLSDYEIVPVGLLAQYRKKDNIPSLEEIQKLNDAVWSKYRVPPVKPVGYRDLSFDYVSSKYASGFWHLGNLYFSKRKYKEALPLYEKATELAADEQWTWDGLGRAYALFGKCQEAKESFEKSLAIRPDDAYVYFHISEVYSVCFHDDGTAKLYKERANKILEQKGLILPLEKF